MNAWATLGAAALHASLLGYLFLGEAPRLKVELKRPPVRIRAAARPTPSPPSLPEPVVEPIRSVPEIAPTVQRPVRQARKEPKRNVAMASRVEPPPPAPVPTPSQPQATPEPVAAAVDPPKPRKFTVALGATVSSGGIAVPVSQAGSTWGLGGGQGIGPDDDDSSPGAGVGSGSGSGLAGGAARRADVSELTTRARLVFQPTDEEMRTLYPQIARRDGLEGDVSLRILVSASGEVLKVKVIKPAGNGFDEAAAAIVKRFRFQAAEVGGQPVEVWIPWTYKFRLEG